jgi:hypothetical protein
VDCPDIPVVWPAEPAVDPVEPVPAVCNDASITSPPRSRAVGPGLVDEGLLDLDGLLHWSATLVALLTLNCLVAPSVAELELIPVLALAELLPGAEAEAAA